MQTGSPTALLAEIDAAERHSLSISRAERAGRFVALWGAVWTVGYLASWRAPDWGNPDWGNIVWIAAILVGIVGSTMLSWRMTNRGGNKVIGRQLGLAAAAFYGFIGACYAVLQPDPLQGAAFIPLVVGLGYVLLGLFWSNRITIAGFAIMGMVIAGWFLFRPAFLPWMAGCGALMVVGGLAMRRA